MSKNIGDATIHVRSFTTGANKADELVGLPGLAAEFDNGAWIIPTNGVGIEDEDRQIGAVWSWINEMRRYPGMALSDTVMACWFAREASRDKFAPKPLFDRKRLLELRALSIERFGLKS